MTTVHDTIDQSDLTDAELRAELAHWTGKVANLNARVYVGNAQTYLAERENAEAMLRSLKAEATSRA